MHYRADTTLINYLINIKHMLDREWDNFIVIAGHTGTGKSIFMLQLIDAWYKVILDSDVDKGLINNITGDIIKWCENLTTLKDYDMNVYDEGLLSMDSKDHMTKTQKEVKKIFNTVRSSKKLFNVIVVQDWFSLTKYFREHRASTLIWIDKRGHYKMYTKHGLKFLNGFNERKSIKSMSLAYPYHQSPFPDYKGILRKPYYDYINELKIKEMQQSINLIKGTTKVALYTVYKNDVKRMLDQGMKHKEIREELGIGGGTLAQCIHEIKNDSKT